MPAFSEQRDESAGVSPTAKTPALRWKEARRTHTYNVSAHVQGSDLSGHPPATDQLPSLSLTISLHTGLPAEQHVQHASEGRNTAGITTPWQDARNPWSEASIGQLADVIAKPAHTACSKRFKRARLRCKHGATAPA